MNLFFNITEENNKFFFYTVLVVDGEFSYAQLKGSVAKILGLSDNSSEDLQHEVPIENQR